MSILGSFVHSYVHQNFHLLDPIEVGQTIVSDLHTNLSKTL